jgi:hypothetical protein
MTERKPAGMSFTSWIDQQIDEARERGAFGNLPGAGKPLPKRRGSGRQPRDQTGGHRSRGTGGAARTPTPPVVASPRPP